MYVRLQNLCGGAAIREAAGPTLVKAGALPCRGIAPLLQPLATTEGWQVQFPPRRFGCCGKSGFSLPWKASDCENSDNVCNNSTMSIFRLRNMLSIGRVVSLAIITSALPQLTLSPNVNCDAGASVNAISRRKNTTKWLACEPTLSNTLIESANKTATTPKPRG